MQREGLDGVMVPNPRISVVVPVYNDEQHLPHALASILSQEPPVHEIIVVDDGSTDGSSAIAHDAARHRGVRVIRQANAGPGAAANAGLGAATGSHVLFVDSDDWLADDAVDSLLSILRHSDPDVVSFAARVVDEHGVHLTGEDRHYAKPDLPQVLSGVAYYRQVQRQGWVTASSKTYLWRREFLQQMRLRVPETYIYEDEVFTPIAVVSASSVVSTSHALYVRMNRPGSLTLRPMTSFNTTFRIESAALLREGATLADDVVGPEAGFLLRERARRLVRIAIIESDQIGNAAELQQVVLDRLGGTGVRALGLSNWLLLRRALLRARKASPSIKGGLP